MHGHKNIKLTLCILCPAQKHNFGDTCYEFSHYEISPVSVIFFLLNSNIHFKPRSRIPPPFCFPYIQRKKIHSNIQQICRFYAVLYLRCKDMRNTGFVSALNQPMLVRYEHVYRTYFVHLSIHQST